MTDDWREANRANWNERVGVHIGTPGYDMAPLYENRAKLYPIEEAELGPVEGLRILHLQCHFGRDSLILAQRGAEVVGVDFSPPAIAEARRLAKDLGLSDRARFVESDVYSAVEAVGEPRSFDRVFVTWGTIGWLPDVEGWARQVGAFLKPGGALYFADGHPTAFVFDDAAPPADGKPGYLIPYFQAEPFVFDDPSDYADDTAVLQNARTFEWVHPISAILTALTKAGLRLDWLHEHAAVPWKMFACLKRGEDDMYRWPNEPWLPLSLSLSASKQ